MGNFLRVEDLEVYQQLCELHVEVCELTREWPVEERYELGWWSTVFVVVQADP